MKNLINLINDINHYGLEINNIKFNRYNVAVETHYKKDDDLITNKIVFEQYDSTKFLDWYRVSNNYIKEGWNSQNHNHKNAFEYFLNLIQRLKEEKGITEETILDKLDLITFHKKNIVFQYSHYDNWETFPFYLEEQTGLGINWERRVNGENELDLINWFTRGY